MPEHQGEDLAKSLRRIPTRNGDRRVTQLVGAMLLSRPRRCACGAPQPATHSQLPGGQAAGGGFCTSRESLRYCGVKAVAWSAKHHKTATEASTWQQCVQPRLSFKGTDSGHRDVFKRGISCLVSSASGLGRVQPRVLNCPTSVTGFPRCSPTLGSPKFPRSWHETQVSPDRACGLAPGR